MNEEYIRQLAKETFEEQDLFYKTFNDLWETENYNFGTIDEDGYHNFDDYTEYPFAIEEMRTLADEYDKIKQQLQAYKDKEDKLREYLTNTEFEERTAYDASFCEGVYNTKEKALRILNEGE